MFGLKPRETAQPVDAQEPLIEPKLDSGQENEVDELSQLREALAKEKEEKETYRRAAQEAKRGEGETRQKLATTEDARFTAEEQAIGNAIAAASAEAERLEREYVELQENGKFAEAAKISRQLASAQGKIDAWEGRKQQFIEWRETQKKQSTQKSKNSELTERTQEWIAKNPWFNTDPVKQKQAIAAHYEADAKGIALDSDEYFQYIEDKVNKKLEEPQPKTTQKTSVTSTALPPSRGNGNMGAKTNGNGEIRLSAEEAEIAVLSNPRIPFAEAQKLYWENKQKLLRDGRINGNAGAA